MKQPIVKKILTALGILSSIYFLYMRYEHTNQSNELKSIVKIYNDGDLDSCEALLLDFTKTYPNNFGGWNFLGNVYIYDHRDSLAEPAYRRSLEIKKENVQALTGLGIIARLRKNYKEAEYLYERAIEIDPKFAQSYSSLVILKIINKNYAAAVELGEKAWRLNQNELGIGGNLALAYHYNNMPKKRDSLFLLLENRGYKYLPNLKMVANGMATLEFFQ